MTTKESDFVVGVSGSQLQKPFSRFLQSHIAHSGKDSVKDIESKSDDKEKTGEENVFETHEGELEFKTLKWPMAAIVMTKIQFGLGILSVPSAFASLGGA